MKKTVRKILAIALTLSMLFSFAICAPSASAANDSATAVAQRASTNGIGDSIKAQLHKPFYDFLGRAVESIVSVICRVFPEPNWTKESDYVTENFMDGTDTFLSTAANGAKWSMGYSSASLLTGSELDGNHYVGGSIKFSKKVAVEIYDDLKVRTVSMNDGSGRGTVVFAVLDAYGLANSDVREIRSRLSDFAQQNNIASINVSVLHQHSAIDTFGMNGDIYKAVFLNPIINIVNNAGLNLKTFNGKNDNYMEHLYQTTADSIKDAYNNMETGRIFYSTVNVKDYIWDKRDPQVNDENLNRLRFVPDNTNSKETWFVTTMIHCVGNGASSTEITGDYPYYMEKVVNEKANANFLLLMGAQQSNSMNRDSAVIPEIKEGMTSLETIIEFGKSIANKLVGIDKSTEVSVSPLLNVRHSEIKLKIDNQIMLVAGKGGLFTNRVLKTEDKGYKVVTEMGYLEIGDNLAFAMIPGELAPELAYGGCFDAAESWSGKDWDYPSMREIIAKNSSRKLLVLGLQNDQVGYIVPDNNYMSILAPEGQSVEFVSLGKNTASTIINDFESLYNSTRG